MVAALLLHKDMDVTVHNNSGDPAIWKLSQATDHAKTLNWVRMFSQQSGNQYACNLLRCHTFLRLASHLHQLLVLANAQSHAVN